MKSLVAAAALAIMSAGPVSAEPALVDGGAAGAELRTVDGETITLARRFVAMFYPTAEQDIVEQFHHMSLAPVEMIQSASIRKGVEREVKAELDSVTPVVKRHVPLIMEAHAQAYAREYSQQELRDLIAFAATPTGRHFLNDTQFSEHDEAVQAAQDEMLFELAPMLERISTAMCKGVTQTRIAAGETDAKCPRA